jgi:hypothetical protein
METFLYASFEPRAIEQRKQGVDLFEVLFDKDRQEVAGRELDRPVTFACARGFKPLLLPLEFAKSTSATMPTFILTGCVRQKSDRRFTCSLPTVRQAECPRCCSTRWFPKSTIPRDEVSPRKRGAAGLRRSFSNH